jgi:uronate dehydrogenase
MRIGNVTVAPPDKRRLSNWISPRDFARLVSVGIENPNIGFEIVYGVSDNKRSWYDNSNAHRLGYQPQDDAERYAEEVLAREKPGDPRAEMYQGGNFVFAEIGGDPSRAAPQLKSAKPKKPSNRKAPAKPKKPVKPKKKK